MVTQFSDKLDWACTSLLLCSSVAAVFLFPLILPYFYKPLNSISHTQYIVTVKLGNLESWALFCLKENKLVSSFLIVVNVLQSIWHVEISDKFRVTLFYATLIKNVLPYVGNLPSKKIDNQLNDTVFFSH